MRSFPFFKFLIAFISGILAGYYSVFQFTDLGFIFGSLLVVFLSQHSYLRRKSILIKYSAPLFIYVFFVSLGNFLICVHDERNSICHFSKIPSQEKIVLWVETNAKIKSKGNILKVIGVQKGRRITPCNGKILMSSGFKQIELKASSRYIVKGEIQKIEKLPLVPGEFDYCRWLNRQNVYHEIITDSFSVFRVSTRTKSFFNDLSFSVQERINSIFQHSLTDPQIQIITAALLVGEDAGLSKKLQEAYSSTGTLHVLAVSGMHVGLLFGIIQFLFSLFSNGIVERIFKYILATLFIWIYAFLTGLSPSILRAVIMLSVFMTAQLIGKKSKSLNTLWISAFVMLMVDPLVLFDLGFQLSMSAVGGILFLYRDIRNFFPSSNKILAFVSDLISVSIAAQVFTLPLCVFYFHQIPLLFIFSNLLIVPLSTLCLFSSLCLFAFLDLSTLFKFFSLISFNLIKWMNDIVLFFHSLPFNSWSRVKFDFFELLLSYVLISVFYYSLKKKWKFGLSIFLTSLILIQVFALSENVKESYTEKIVVIKSGRKFFFLFQKGQKGFVFLGSKREIDNAKLKNYLAYKGLTVKVFFLKNEKIYKVICQGKQILFSPYKFSDKLSSKKFSSEIVFLIAKKSLFYKRKSQELPQQLHSFLEIEL